MYCFTQSRFLMSRSNNFHFLMHFLRVNGCRIFTVLVFWLSQAFKFFVYDIIKAVTIFNLIILKLRDKRSFLLMQEDKNDICFVMQEGTLVFKFCISFCMHRSNVDILKLLEYIFPHHRSCPKFLELLLFSKNYMHHQTNVFA